MRVLDGFSRLVICLDIENKFFQDPITRSFHLYCTLESTHSRFFLFLELLYFDVMTENIREVVRIRHIRM